MQIVFRKNGWQWVTASNTDAPVTACCLCGNERAVTVRLTLGKYVLRLCREHRPNAQRPEHRVALRVHGNLAQASKVNRRQPEQAARQMAFAL